VLGGAGGMVSLCVHIHLTPRYVGCKVCLLWVPSVCSKNPGPPPTPTALRILRGTQATGPGNVVVHVVPSEMMTQEEGNTLLGGSTPPPRHPGGITPPSFDSAGPSSIAAFQQPGGAGVLHTPPIRLHSSGGWSPLKEGVGGVVPHNDRSRRGCILSPDLFVACASLFLTQA
jgi:hypothetical protein